MRDRKLGAPAPRFEWFVAWRHLRDSERRTHRMLIFGLVVLVLGIGCVVAAHLLGKPARSPEGFLQVRPTMLAENLRTGGFVGIGVGIALAYLGALLACFTLFTAISIAGVSVGTSLPIVTLSVMSGFESDLKTKILGAKASVVISVADGRPFTDWQEVHRKIAGVPGVVASTPYLEAEVMIRSGPSAMGIVLRGIDPATAGGVLDLARTLDQGEGKLEHLARPELVEQFPRSRAGGGPFEDLDRAAAAEASRAKADERAPDPDRRVLPTILLGKELYRSTLRVFLGDEVEVICPVCRLTPLGAGPGSDTFRVAGYFYSGMYEFDSKLAYVALPALQKFLQTPGEITALDVRTRTPEQSREVARAIAARIGAGYEVRTWEDLNKGLFRALNVEKIAMFVGLAVIGLVASFSIVATLIMSVTQKAREVAILKSMGATDGAIRRIFFAEGLYIGLFGLTLGVAYGVVGCKLMVRYGLPLPTDVYYINQLPVLLRAGEVVSIAALALVLSCLATVYPALVASRLRPVEGLRYE